MTCRFGVFSIFALVSSVTAQPRTPDTPAPAPRTAAAAVQPEVDPAIAQRRLTALSLLRSLADEARSYRDEALRARVQARVADALWDDDRENARDLFHRAWASAEAIETKPNVASSLGRTSRNAAP